MAGHVDLAQRAVAAEPMARPVRAIPLDRPPASVPVLRRPTMPPEIADLARRVRTRATALVRSCRAALGNRSTRPSSMSDTGLGVLDGVTRSHLAGLASIVAAVGLLTLVLVSALSSRGQGTEQGVLVAAVGVFLALLTAYLGAELLTGPSPIVLATAAAGSILAAMLVFGYLLLVGAETASAAIVLLGVTIAEVAAGGMSIREWLADGRPRRDA